MKKLSILVTILLMSMLVAACDGDESNQPAAAESSPVTSVESAAPTTEAQPLDTKTPTGEATSCPEATADTYLLRDPRHGFCLLYPVGHKVERPNPDEVALVIGGLLNSGDPRAGITVTPTDGRTAADYADEIVASFEGFEITRSDGLVAGEPAVILDNLPGQDINRRVIFSHEDRLYHIYFSPIDPENPGPIDLFAEGILGSFTFIPASNTVTAADECVTPKADQQQVLDDEFGYCFLAPADFTYERPSETNANLFFGSMMDVEHPKLMIEVVDAAGRTAAIAADELAASFEGFDIQRSFGDTLGYETAERLDGVPGQDIGRVLLVAHGDRLYRLTFAPADPSQGDIYTRMEAMFAELLSTFRFLP